MSEKILEQMESPIKIEKTFNLSVEEFQTQLLKEMKVAEEKLKGKVEEKIMSSYKVLEKKMELPTGEVTVVVDEKNYPYFRVNEVAFSIGRSRTFFGQGVGKKLPAVYISELVGRGSSTKFFPLEAMSEALKFSSQTFLQIHKQTREQFIDSTMAAVWKFCAENNLATERTAEVSEQNLFPAEEQTFGERLRALREERGLKEVDVAIGTKISAISISSYELGKTNPDREKLIRLAKYFGVTLDELVYGKKKSATEERLERLEKQVAELMEFKKIFGELKFQGVWLDG